MREALRISKNDLIQHAELDSVIFLRIYIISLKIFVPMTILALLVLIPVNVYDGTLKNIHKDIVFSGIDKLSISNVREGSQRFWFHLSMAYLFTIWTCYVLYKEYGHIAFMRLHFLEDQDRRAAQFTVVVRNIPHVSGQSISESVDQFFQRNHPEHYLGHQLVAERQIILKDPKAIMPVAFVSFDSRWAGCYLCSNSTK
ncbi:CSC1-like protein At1g32090 [Asparagus officinalis]|uniref:CSC1-like protein At1g32090 n=1 Tax=Asparagus officinalis TaxID=4686 RepID=UPI00098E5068|nr:CSC1-like protein At1g32090 [Asparagus officinalis]